VGAWAKCSKARLDGLERLSPAPAGHRRGAPPNLRREKLKRQFELRDVMVSRYEDDGAPTVEYQSDNWIQPGQHVCRARAKPDRQIDAAEKCSAGSNAPTEGRI